MKRSTLGKRERVAGKRHKRGVIYSPLPSGSEPLKLGRKHFQRFMRKCLAVAENENLE
jgi:hypothetical protein